MTPDLVQLKNWKFEALVPSFQDMPANKVLQIFNSSESTRQFDGLRELLRDALPPEKVTEFDSLGIGDLMEIVAQWVKPDES